MPPCLNVTPVDNYSLSDDAGCSIPAQTVTARQLSDQCNFAPSATQQPVTTIRWTCRRKNNPGLVSTIDLYSAAPCSCQAATARCTFVSRPATVSLTAMGACAFLGAVSAFFSNCVSACRKAISDFVQHTGFQCQVSFSSLVFCRSLSVSSTSQSTMVNPFPLWGYRQRATRLFSNESCRLVGRVQAQIPRMTRCWTTWCRELSLYSGRTIACFSCKGPATQRIYK
ncbi:hypothetical protein HDK77DRAFT_115241 [Phyllosticta capitalensis]